MTSQRRSSAKWRAKKRHIRYSMENIKSQRLIEGFYYAYLHPEEVGDRSKGWLMMATDKEGVVS